VNIYNFALDTLVNIGEIEKEKAEVEKRALVDNINQAG